LTSDYVLCRKSTDLSWEGDEPSATADEEAFAPAAEESAPLPQGETVAPAAEAALPEASIVEGEYTAEMQPSSSSSRSPRETDLVYLLFTGAEVEGSTIPEVVPVEGTVPEAEVAAGAATEPAKIASGVAPGVAEEPKRCVTMYCVDSEIPSTYPRVYLRCWHEFYILSIGTNPRGITSSLVHVGFGV
jgi:hypothetical protein